MNEENQSTENQELSPISYELIIPQDLEEQEQANQEELWKKAFEKIRVSC